MMETNKYIIELEEMIVSTANGQMPLYKTKGLNTPTFDSVSINKLTPYSESDLSAVRNEAYKEAYDKGYQDAVMKIGSDEQAIVEKAYQYGLSAAWETARWLAKSNAGINFKIFGRHFTNEIVQEISASEAIDKIQQYEQEQEEQFQVGDEVNGKGGKGIITRISDDGDHFNVMWENGSTGYYMMEDFKKIGRHFPEIAEILKKMQEEKE